MKATEVRPTVVRPRRVWRWLLIGTGMCFAATALAVYNVMTPTREATTLREELISSLGTTPHTRIQLSVGPVILGTARAAAGLIPDVPPEARMALRAVRKASVGVYALDGASSSPDRIRMISSADKVMQQRGWTRVVGVNDAQSLVLVYVPDRMNSGSSEKVCVAVCNDEHLVIVSGTISPQPLVEMAMQKQLIARR